MIIFKIFGYFLLFYISLFIIVLILTNIMKYVKLFILNERKKEELSRKRDDLIIKPKKEIKKTFNKSLGIWEIEND